jgi:predicted nucleotidyltransferase
MDLSAHIELTRLAEAVRDVARAAERVDARLFVAGAVARDLWLQHGHGFATGRATEDLDFAVQCATWDQFEKIVRALFEVNIGRPNPQVRQRFVHPNGTAIDLVPFGGVERADRTIAWPPDEGQALSLMGFREAVDSTVRFLLPGGIAVSVASLAALAALKVVAWQERHVLAPRKDAADLYVILENYADAGNRSRLFDELPGVGERDDFDFELAGAELLGRDLAQTLTGGFLELVLRILRRESDPRGELRLASEMDPQDPDRARAHLAALQLGLEAQGPPPRT